MKVRKLISILSLCWLASMPSYGQKDIPLREIKTTIPIKVAMPMKVDSTNLKDKKFDNAELLKTEIVLPEYQSFTRTVIATDTTNYLALSKPSTGNSFQLLNFKLTADRYSKPTIKVSAPSMFEVYIDGKKEFSKATIEDSIKLAKEEKKELTLMPSISQNIIIKYLSTDKNKANEGIKITLVPEKKDTLTNFSFSLDKQRPTKILDIMEGVRVTSSSISPNGQFVILKYRSVEKGGAATTFTQVMNTNTGKTIDLGDAKIAWMPTTNAYHQTVKRGNKSMLVATNPETMEETVIVKNVPIGSYYILPNEKSLLSLEKESFDERKGDLKALASPEDRQAGYYDMYYIYKYDIATGLKTRLTFGKESTYIRDISADSKYILFTVTNETVTERPFRKSTLYKMNLEDLSTETIWKNEKFVSSAYFSPDAKKILISGSGEAFDGIGLKIKEGQTSNTYDGQAFIMDLETKQIDPISKDFNPAIQGMDWCKANGLIYLQAEDKDCVKIFSYNPKNKKFSELPLEEEVVRSFDVSSNSAFASYTGLSTYNSAKAYSLNLSGNKSTELSNPTKEIFDELQLGKVEDWSFTSSDGTKIDGRYFLPPNFDAKKKYPMIVYYYGGTSPTNRAFEHPYSMHVYAAMGYVVYTINPSGTTGWGQEFAARHVNAWGKRTAEDIIEGTSKFVKDHTFVDSKKIGCIGASYGGFMTQYLQTKTDLFAAAISHAGISSISSYWGEGYWGYTYSSGASANSYPWNNKELYVNQSPLFNADKVNTPILFLHGTADTNVPIGESIQMYTALKILGKPTEFVQVKDENHGIVKYDRKLQWNYTIYSWFERWLKDDPAWWNNLYPHRKTK